MGLIIHSEKINATIARSLAEICPFGAVEVIGETIAINSACKLCKLCVRKGPAGAITFEDNQVLSCDKNAYSGIAVFAEQRGGKIHPVSLELLGKARSLAGVISQPVIALLIGSDLASASQELLRYGADRVYVYDDPRLKDFLIAPYTNAFTDFIEKVKPSSVLVGATSLGRSVAPRTAARVHSGLTADCTMLEMKENTDLVQIRPAFGGNIMAQIISPNARPQFCTVRYKIFSAPPRGEAHGEIIRMEVTEEMTKSKTSIISIEPKPTQIDISDAEVIVACGRGVKSKEDLSLCQMLADVLGAQMACTRPLVESGFMEPTRQIGLSGRTVHPKLIVTIGVSGSVQFAAGMRSSDCILAVNTDRNAPIFDIAHYGFVGDLYGILPKLIQKIQSRPKW